MGTKRVAPENPCFGSGPAAKFSEWSRFFPEMIKKHNALGRSHRSRVCKNILNDIIDLNREILGIPGDYLVGIFPASDTGAFETALWNLITPQNDVECYFCGSFGKTWFNDLKKLNAQPKGFTAPYGELFELRELEKKVDVVTVWNETTSGVMIPFDDFNNWITDDHGGLVFIDATSALFAMEFPWRKADVISWSPQKGLGSEAAFGMLALSPKAIARLENTKSNWPIAKIMNLRKDGKILKGPFEADVINTISMIGALDFQLSLQWAKKHGLDELIEKTNENSIIIERWVNSSCWVDFLVKDKKFRSTTSVTLKITDERLKGQNRVNKKIEDLVGLIEEEKMGYDIKSYKEAPVGLRIWCGPTVERINLLRLIDCIDWAWSQVMKNE